MRWMDVDGLQAFVTVARVRNMRKAANLLNITQPPLSRKIRLLERRIGAALFTRRPDGLELTAEGCEALTLVEPFLRQAAELEARLSALAPAESQDSALGITTACEQEVFAPYLDMWRREITSHFSIVRKESPKLIRDVKRGRLAAAFVALPADTAGLECSILNYEERLMAALSVGWPEARLDRIELRQLNGRPLFWFQRRRNPAFFDHMQAQFNICRFAPQFLEEPPEHDVLLARIAFGDGFALLPQSFAAVTRAGVKYVALSAGGELRLRLGYVYGDGHYALDFAV